nr:tetratricopeptide repeat protein [Spirochaetota bacterium]
YQKKRAQDVQVRHQKLLDKVSTIPEKMALRAGGDAANMARDETAAGSETSESNTMFMEALDAHLDNRLERALELYTQILLETPNHYIYNHRGLVYFAMSDYRKAVDDFTAAIELQPGDTRVYTNRGLAYRMLREYESALADFERSIDINPFWADTFYGRALTHYDMGNVSAALADCDVAIDIKPGFKQVVRFKQFLLSIMQGA